MNLSLSIAVMWVLLIYTNLIHYLANKEFIPIYPKHIVLLGVLLFIWGFFSREIKIKIVNLSFVYTNIAGALMAVIFYLMLYMSDRYIDSVVALDELGVILFYAVCMISLICFSRSKVYPVIEGLLPWVFMLGVVLNLVDFLGNNIEVFSKIPGRASGLYVNPNIAAFMLSVSYVLIHRSLIKSLRLVFFVAFVLAVLTTASRAGMLYLVIIIPYLLISGYFFVWSKKAIAFNLILVVVLLVSSALLTQGVDHILGEISDVNRALEARVTQFQKIMGGDDSSLEVKEDGRFELLIGHYRRYMESPVMGNGLGFSRSEQLSGFDQASHNVYLHFLNEYGLLGLVFYLFFLFNAFGARVLRFRNNNFEPHLLLLMLLVGGVFSHNLNRYYFVAILLGYAGAKYRVFGGAQRNKR